MSTVVVQRETGIEEVGDSNTVVDEPYTREIDAEVWCFTRENSCWIAS